MRRLLGDWEGAIADFTRTLALDPKHPEALVSRGWSLLAVGRDGGDGDARAYLDLKPSGGDHAPYMAVLGVLLGACLLAKLTTVALVPAVAVALAGQLALRRERRFTVWQRNYYEEIVRDAETLERIRTYVRNNPARWHADPENPEAREDATC